MMLLSLSGVCVYKHLQRLSCLTTIVFLLSFLSLLYIIGKCFFAPRSITYDGFDVNLVLRVSSSSRRRGGDPGYEVGLTYKRDNILLAFVKLATRVPMTENRLGFLQNSWLFTFCGYCLQASNTLCHGLPSKCDFPK